MKSRVLLIITSTALIMTACTGNKNEVEKSSPGVPQAKKIEKVFEEHGTQRTDNYYWLRERENPEVIAYLEAENAYTESIMEDTKDLQDKIYNEIVGRIKQDDSSYPVFDNGYYYYSRFEKGKEYRISCRKKETLDAPEEIILDENVLAEPHSYYDIAGMEVSPDNQLLAYGEDTVSRRKYTIQIKSIATGELLDKGIPNTTGGSVWANDNKTLFYAVKDHTLRSYKIMRHTLGTDQKNDVTVYEETDATFDVSVGGTKTRKYIIIHSSSTMSDEVRFIDADDPTGEMKIVQPRIRGLEYSVSHAGDEFYIRTNLEATNFKLVTTPVNNPGKENWVEVIPHRDSVMLTGVDVFKNYLALEEKIDGLTQIRILKRNTNEDHYISFKETAFETYVEYNPEYETDSLRISYSSLTTPRTLYSYNMSEKKKTILKQTEVLGGYNADDYQTERISATAKDGTKVPISLVYRKDKKLSKGNPILVYAYGSYGAATDPYFRTHVISLLDRGFVYAIAHIRGGDEMGRKWYEDGKLLKKKNTFTDFIDCTEFLINSGYGDPNQVFAYGGSAGGLLMGAVANMKPELYKGMIAAVPFVDVITTMLDETIPLTTGEYDEWGNPNNKEYYDYMLSYSPYDNVERKAYPSILVTTGLHDSQVQYWEPAKWVAKLREMKTDDNLLLLYTNMEAGHGGASGRFEMYKEVAMEYAFFLKLIGNLN